MSSERNRITVVNYQIEQIPYNNTDKSRYSFRALFPHEEYFKGITELIIVEPWFSHKKRLGYQSKHNVSASNCTWEVFDHNT